MQPGLIIVSNVLPVGIKKIDGKLEFSNRSGGMATSLASYASNNRNKWVGWPGIASDELTEKDRALITEKLATENCYPVFLTQKQIDGYYSGYSNSVLWPIFHDGKAGKAAKDTTKLWQMYRKVNGLFADAVLAISAPGSNIWVHDYHLMVLPALLRKERPKDKIGFFLHAAFPNAKRFLAIKEAEGLLTGVLGADLVGFQTESYVNDFLDAVQQLEIGLTAHHKVILDNRVVRVTNFPISINYEKYEKARKSHAVTRHYAKLKLAYSGQKVILMVDRLDPAKNLVGRLEAYRTLLRENPRLHGKVTMIALVVPSREGVAEHQKLKRDIERTIKETNDEFGPLPWQPIDYTYANLPFDQVTALYRRADVAFIAPKRDGMNLVAKEYVASQHEHNGALVLSKTVGAAEELKDAVMVDPLLPLSLVKGLSQALALPPKELKRRVSTMQKQIAGSNVQTWASKFMRSLKRTSTVAAGHTVHLDAELQKELVAAYKDAKNRLLLLDYDGVLIGFFDRPNESVPPKKLKKLLEKLAHTTGNTLVIASGRTTENMDKWLGDLGLNFAAEHGAFRKQAGSKTWEKAETKATKNWQQRLLPLMEKYAARAPGAFVEQKTTALVWHYRLAKPYAAQKNLVALKRVLIPLAESLGLVVRQGQMIIEIKPYDLHKGMVASRFIDKLDPDFVLLLGDDSTDEDMFRAAPLNSYTIKVGRGTTEALYRLKNVDEVLQLLEKLAKA